MQNRKDDHIAVHDGEIRAEWERVGKAAADVRGDQRELPGGIGDSVEKSVDFVEDGGASLHALKANVALFPMKRRARVFKRDAIPFVERLDAGAYDLAFADPPYGSRKLDRVIRRWLAVPFAPLLCVEHDSDHVLPGRGTRHLFGDVSVTFYRAEVPPRG